MATKDMTKDFLHGLSQIIQEKKITETIIDAYHEKLKYYSEMDLHNVFNKCLDEYDYFPTVKQIKKLIHPNKDNEKHIQEERERYTCPKCHNYVHFIFEGVCQECHSGIPISAGRTPVKRKEYLEDKEKDYIIQENTRCNKCGHIGYAIKEPISKGDWRCKQCYTGPAQYKQKLHDLVERMGK